MIIIQLIDDALFSDKLPSYKWVTYIVSTWVQAENSYIDPLISNDVSISFFNPFAQGSLFGSQIAPPSSPTEGQSSTFQTFKAGRVSLTR